MRSSVAMLAAAAFVVVNVLFTSPTSMASRFSIDTITLPLISGSNHSLVGVEEEVLAAANVETTTTAEDVNNTTTASEVCFVTCIYLSNITLKSQRPVDVSRYQRQNPQFRFFLFTNLQHLDAPGWTEIHHPLEYRRLITASRWGKFLGWKHAMIQQNCRTVFYMDASYAPVAPARAFEDKAREIRASRNGIAQYNHPIGGTINDEFDRIRTHHKDVESNINASITWFKSQPDFTGNCTLRRNTFFGYDPTNPRFQQATTFFWSHYGQELDSWRDQPLWCHVSERYNLVPVPLTPQPITFWVTKVRGKPHSYTSQHDGNKG